MKLLLVKWIVECASSAVQWANLRDVIVKLEGATVVGIEERRVQAPQRVDRIQDTGWLEKLFQEIKERKRGKRGRMWMKQEGWLAGRDVR